MQRVSTWKKAVLVESRRLGARDDIYNFVIEYSDAVYYDIDSTPRQARSPATRGAIFMSFGDGYSRYQILARIATICVVACLFVLAWHKGKPWSLYARHFCPVHRQCTLLKLWKYFYRSTFPP